MKLFCSDHHPIEILFPTAVPTQHLDEHRQPHFPMTPNSLDTPTYLKNTYLGTFYFYINFLIFEHLLCTFGPGHQLFKLVLVFLNER